jgi:cytoskeletal protein CcmA (bactofilin family)
MFGKQKDVSEPAAAAAEPRRSSLPPGAKAPLSIIAPGCVITGVVSSPGDLQIEGDVVGDVQCAALSVGQNGAIKGDVTAESLLVRGTITGGVRARNVQLAASGRIEGDIVAAQLVIEAGGAFEGRSRRDADPLSGGGATGLLSGPRTVEPEDIEIAIPAR